MGQEIIQGIGHPTLVQSLMPPGVPFEAPSNTRCGWVPLPPHFLGHNPSSWEAASSSEHCLGGLHQNKKSFFLFEFSYKFLVFVCFIKVNFINWYAVYINYIYIFIASYKNLIHCKVIDKISFVLWTTPRGAQVVVPGGTQGTLLLVFGVHAVSGSYLGLLHAEHNLNPASYLSSLATIILWYRSIIMELKD